MSTSWHIKGRELANCNCAYGCPCQFNSLPTHGNCKALIGYQIDEGTFGDVRLDGLRAALIASWPGPIHEGKGTLQAIIDERADARQREALGKIIYGEDTKEMATMWWVYSAMSSTKLDPLYKPIELELDVEKRTGRMTIPGVAEMKGEPIRNPVTGAEHRVRIDLPHGFEFRIAEIGSGTTRATGAVALHDLQNTYG